MRAIIVAGQGVQDQEFFYPLYRLQEAGYHVDVAVSGRREKEICTGFFGMKVVPTVQVAEISPFQYNLLVIPGGVKAMEHMRLDKLLVDQVEHFHREGGFVASICSGAQLLISAKIVKGKRISAYYAMQVDVENAGAEFVDAPAVVSGRIITSPHYRYLGQWMKATLEELAKTGDHA